MTDIDILNQIEKELKVRLGIKDRITLHPCYTKNQNGQVTGLWLFSCEIESLNRIISPLVALTNLTQLDLHDNELSDISPLAALTNLTQLYLGGNELSDISPLAALTNLTQLDLSYNRLSDISPLKGLKNLKSLTLQDNPIEEVPLWITDFSMEIDWTYEWDKDNCIIFYDNPLKSPPPEIMKQGKEAIRNYFEQIKEQEEDYIFEAKMLIVGEPGAGKTTLAWKMEDPDCELPKEDKSTKGIEVKQYYFPLRREDFGTFEHTERLEKRKIRLNMWDFGGQEIYKATHRFFLSKRSLYALVADSRNEDTDFNYWLHIVEMFGGDSPLLIVLNEKLQRKRNLDISAIKKRFTNISEVLDVDFAERDKGRLNKLEKAVKYHVSQLPHIGNPVPAKWTVVREALEEDKRNTISLEDYLGICHVKGITKTKDALVLSQYFHDIGVFLHFQDDELLRKTIFLKPNWATHAVYKILDHPLLNKNNGRFNKDDARTIWCEEEYALVRHELLRLMQKFFLTYEIDRSGEYIVPERLHSAPPIYAWDNRENLFFQYKYEFFMPKGILSQFIVQMHRFIGDHDYVWRRGVLLDREQSRAEIIECYDARAIHIKIVGKNRRDFLTLIIDQLDQINAQYEKMKVEKLIPCNCDECKTNEKPYFYTYQNLKRRIENRVQEVQCELSYKMVNVLALIDDVIDRERFREEIESRKLMDDEHIRVNVEHAGQVIIQHTDKGSNIVEQKIDNARIKSSWANGSFYLFSFLTIIAISGFFAGSIPIYTLALIIVAGILVVPIIGALQLRQDDRLSEKSFLELVRMVLSQLPLIGKLAGKAKE